jgi:DNA-directed RNA polymerase sigma subunit (sigma70/sigma32)
MIEAIIYAACKRWLEKTTPASYREVRWHSDPYFLTLMRRYPGGATQREIAKAEGVSYQAIQHVEARALRKLRESDDPAVAELLEHLAAA